MDGKEYDALLDLIDQMVVTSEPRRGEYFRGYLRGIQFHVLGTLEISVQEHSQLCDATDEPSGDHYLDAFAQGYRDGCRGLKPEHTA